MVSAEWVLFRIIDTRNLHSLSEYSEMRGNPVLFKCKISNRMLASNEKLEGFAKGIAKDFSTAVRFHTLSTSAILYQMLDRLIDEDMAFVLKARREIESLEEAMDQGPESVQIDQVLALKRRAARLSITFEDQRYCATALQTVECEVFDITDFRDYFRNTMEHLESALRSVGRQEARLVEVHQHYLLTLRDKTNKRLSPL